MLTKQGFKRPFADYVYSSPASPEKKIRTPVKKIDQFTIKKIIKKKLAKCSKDIKNFESNHKRPITNQYHY